MSVFLSYLLVSSIKGPIERKLSSGFLPRPDTNRAVQPQKMVRGLIGLMKERYCYNCTIYIATTMVLISCAVTHKFSYDMAHI